MKGLQTRFPSQGIGRLSLRPERLLILCYYDPAGISTVPETVAYMQSCSRFSVSVLNLYEQRYGDGPLMLPPSLDLDAWSGIVIHNSISYNVDNLRQLDAFTPRKLKDYAGVKILMKQDENYRFREIASYIGQTGFDLVLTCLPPEAVPLVYPRALAGNPVFDRMLTGYITPTLRALHPNSGIRPIDIGYRGSLQPLSFGRLAFEKRKIGDDVKRLLAGSGLTLDISSRTEDRFGGDAWFDFLGSCKATLGAESGASIFDLDGDLEQRLQTAEEKHGPASEDDTYIEAVLGDIADLENNVRYHQVSPRHFEAVATRTLQLLYPGAYSDILMPERHYFALARDYSNLAEAIALVADDAARAQITTAAYDEIIQNKEWWIESFVGRLDDLVETAMQDKNCLLRSTAYVKDAALNILLIAPHQPYVDPRLSWIEQGAPEGMIVHQLGVSEPNEPPPILKKGTRGGLDWSFPRQLWQAGTCDKLYPLLAHDSAGMAGLNELALLERSLALPDAKFASLFGTTAENRRLTDWRWYAQFVLDVSATLIFKAANMRGVHALITTDLYALPAGLIIKSLLGVQMLYDAHEYMPHSDTTAHEYESQFWSGMEKRLAVHADYRQTVSTGLADIMAAEYGVPFACLPNCEPAKHAKIFAPRPSDPARVKFLFQGGFSAHRGIALLIDAWKDTDERAILILRGPERWYKTKMVELAARTGLLGTRIFFPPPVAESELIDAACEADVGLIPYEPFGMNHKHCCPNKTSQYMAAGLPILANNTDYVRSVVEASGAGIVINFAHKKQLIEAVGRFIAEPELSITLGRAGNDYFRNHFNWDVQSKSFYEMLQKMIQGSEKEKLRYYDSLLPFASSILAVAPSEIMQPVQAIEVVQTFNRLNTAQRAWQKLPIRLRRTMSPAVGTVKNVIGLNR